MDITELNLWHQSHFKVGHRVKSQQKRPKKSQNTRKKPEEKSILKSKAHKQVNTKVKGPQKRSRGKLRNQRKVRRRVAILERSQRPTKKFKEKSGA